MFSVFWTTFQERKSVNSVCKWSILAVRIAKFGPLREPIRMLLFTLDQFSHTINYGCILLGLFWLFLFQFRNKRIHGISISKRNALTFWKRNTRGGGDLRTTTSSNRKPGDQRGRLRWISRQKFPKRRRILCILSKPYSVHSVHSAIGSRMNGMIFCSFWKRISSKKNTNTIYSE